ncbi:MAG: penicillin-binding transpeptidase domain-containing protein [Algisphaera sp.]
MRSILRDILPSMFHRRLLLLVMVVLLLVGILAAKTAHLTTGGLFVASQEELEKRLRQTTLIPTVRGKMYDRKNRLLAEDRPGWDVQVHFSVFSGDWAFDQAADAARRAYGKATWKGMTLAEKQVAAEPFGADFLLQINRLWVTLAEVGGLPPQVIERRQRLVVARVGRLTANASAYARKQRMERLNMDREDISFTDTYTRVREEGQSHAILYDLTPEQLETIYVFVDKAKLEEEAWRQTVKEARRKGEPMPPDTRSYGIWLMVEPQRVNKRSYPWESHAVLLDRTTLPGPMRRSKPLEAQVEGVARHVIGSMRRVNKDDRVWTEKPYKLMDENGDRVGSDLAGYQADDLIGRGGIESSMESVLRGSRGRHVRRRDTGAETTTPPVAGHDVRLTLDIQLQARIQALMAHDRRVGLMFSQEWHHAPDMPKSPKPGEPLNGAAVVLDIDNGEVLAAVSTPGVTLEDFRDASRGLYTEHRDARYRFRPLEGVYDPGSTNKPLIAAAAITDGILGPNEKLDCSRGKLWENSNAFRDWIYRKRNGWQTFGEINVVQAITVSSNVFFGQLAQRWGMSEFGYGRVPWWLSQYGMGRKAGCGLNEAAGTLIRPNELEALPATQPESTAAYMTIGEAGLSVTPLQVAAAHATLARGGLYIPPTLVMDDSRPGPPRETWQLNLAPSGRDRALKGMDRSANYKGTIGSDRGTTYQIKPQGKTERVFNCPGVHVYAKSGTAQAAPQRAVHTGGKLNGRPIRNVDAQGRVTYGEVVREGNHGWVVALVGPDGETLPTHVVVVVMEYAGSGGASAGPVVNQIIHALRTEGYLGELPVEPAIESDSDGEAAR